MTKRKRDQDDDEVEGVGMPRRHAGEFDSAWATRVIDSIPGSYERMLEAKADIANGNTQPIAEWLASRAEPGDCSDAVDR